MQRVVIDEPYEFVPPYPGRLWPRLLQHYVGRKLRHGYGVERLECDGLDQIRQSIAAGHSVILAPNHCRPADPLVVTEMCRRARVTPFTMASWHLFAQSRFQRFLLRRIGAFSVYREGLDRQALQAGVEILQQPKRPLVIFPEGVITRTNDRVLALMDGVSFIARTAAKKRAAAHPPGKVVIHPVAIRYHFHGDIDAAVHETLTAIEERLSWQPMRDEDRVQRIYRVGEALLCLKEIEYFGRPRKGDFTSRLERLIDQIIVPLEEEWGIAKSEGTVVARVKQLRFAMLPEMIDGKLSKQETERRWRQLADMYIAQQLGHYPPDYVKSNPSPERLLETVERFEEDLTDVCQIHKPMSASVKIGEPIEVNPKRVRGAEEDPLMVELENKLNDLLEIQARDAAVDDSQPEKPSVNLPAPTETNPVEVGTRNESV